MTEVISYLRCIGGLIAANKLRKKLGRKQGITLFILITLCGCSLQKMAIRSTGGILDYGLTALYEEDDLQLAEQAIVADLKLLEGLIKGDPENEHLLLLASQGYSSYALGFVEDEDVERAKKFYLRGWNYGLKILTSKKEFQSALRKDLDTFKNSVYVFSKKDIPALFWTANAWGNWINLSKSDPTALVDLPKVQLLMQRVLELDEGYFYGGAHLFFGTLLAARPKILGGNPEKAKEHFERCLVLNQGKFLLTYVYYAKFYAVQVQDRALFEKLLQKVITASGDILPEQRLANEIAKRKARALFENADELFL